MSPRLVLSVALRSDMTAFRERVRKDRRLRSSHAGPERAPRPPCWGLPTARLLTRVYLRSADGQDDRKATVTSDERGMTGLMLKKSRKDTLVEQAQDLVNGLSDAIAPHVERAKDELGP